MSNKYCNLDGTKKIKNEYTKINNGFAGVEADINEVDDRVDTIITTPIDGAAAAQEIVDARVSAAKSKSFATLDARFEEAEQDHASHKAEIVNANEFGAVADKTTDNTTAVKLAINKAYNEGKSVQILNGTKWYYTQLQKYKTGTVSANNAVTLSDINTTGDDYIGGVVFNKTDKSFGIIESQTSNSVTVRQLFKGTNNTFTIGDSYEISLLKVDVTIYDDSRFDPFFDEFTGQSKIVVNSDNPHVKSANEFDIMGQYHPAGVVTNTSNSSMENRASHIQRRVIDGKLVAYHQIGINPLNGTIDPKEYDYMSVASVWDEATSSYKSQILEGYKIPYSDCSYYTQGGDRPETGYAYKHNHKRNEIHKRRLGARSTQRIEIEFANEEVVKNTLRHWGAYEGFTGYKTIVIHKIASEIIDYTLYCGALLTNKGATATITLTLSKDAPIGYEQEFVVYDNQLLYVQLQANGGTFLTPSGNTTLFYSSTIGDSIKVKRLDADKWQVKLNGTWT